MHFENLLASLNIRVGDNDLPVKTSWAQQSWVKNIGPVSGRHKDHPFVGLKAIHLNQQLVERLFALVIATAKACATMASDRVDFVNEDNARRVLLGLFKHIAHAAGTNAHEHFNKVRTGNRKEGNIGFARNGASQQCFTCSRRANQKRALRNFSAEALKFVGVLEEVNDFDQVFLGLIYAGHIIEGHSALLFREQFSLGLAKAHGLAGARLHLPDEKYPDAD